MRKSLTLFFALFFLSSAQFCDAASIPASVSIQEGGYSVGNYCSSDATAFGPNFVPAKIYSNRCSLTWAQRFLPGIFFDLDQGYVDPNWDGARQVIMADQGSGYSTAPTVTITGGGCGIAPTFGTPTLFSGHVTGIPITFNGWGCQGGVMLSFSGGGGTGAQAFVVIGGSGNFGVPGESTAGLLARIGDLTASNASSFVLETGANDRNLSITPAQTITNLQSIWGDLTGAGKTVFDHVEGPVQPSGCPSGCVFNTNQAKEIAQTNTFRKNWVRTVQSEAGGTAPPVFSFDSTAGETDATSAVGAPLPGMRDTFGVHPTTQAGIIDALKLIEIYKKIYGLTPGVHTSSQIDMFDATYNPTGWLNQNPFMLSSGGYNPSPCTGTLAANWAFNRDSGTATTSCSLAVSARTDGYTGNQQVFTVSAGSGDTQEFYSLYDDDTPANYNIAAGDVIQGWCDVDASNTHNLNWMEFDIVPFTTGYASQVFNLNDGDNYLSNDHYPDVGQLGALDGHPMTWRTMPYTVPSGATFASIAIFRIAMHIGFDASGGSGSAGGTFKITNCGVRKVQ